MHTSETTSLDSLPDHSRLWVFAAARPLEPTESAALLQRVDHFLRQWHAHGHPVVGARELRADQFVLVAADESATGVSGCSIDSLFRVLRELEREIGAELLNGSLVHYRDERGGVRTQTRAEFREQVRAGHVGEDTRVFDNTVGTLGALRAGEWERPMRDAWHGRAFRRG
jgi:hypothetical protein